MENIGDFLVSEACRYVHICVYSMYMYTYTFVHIHIYSVLLCFAYKEKGLITLFLISILFK